MSGLVPKNQLTENQRRCAEILATNEINKYTIPEIAEMLGVSERTVYRWKRDPAFIRYKNQISEEVMEDFLSDAYVQLRALLTEGKSEKTKLEAIKLILQNRGKLKDNGSGVTINVNQNETQEERERRIIEMERELLELTDSEDVED